MNPSMIAVPNELVSRSLGKFPISIGTSNALEGFFGLKEGMTKSPHRSYGNILVNLRTLIRNIYQSVPTNDQTHFTPSIMIKLMTEEMILIRDIVRDQSGARINTYWYLPMYQQIDKTYPNARTIESQPPKQQIYFGFELATYQLLLKLQEADVLKEFIHIPDKWFGFNISDNLPNIKGLPLVIKPSVLLTHISLDLLTINPPKKGLLESHTGAVKGPSEFPTKLKGKPENMPFDIMTLQMFGDTAGLFLPMQQSFRTELLKVAKQKHWNFATTPMRIKMDVKSVGTPQLYQEVMKLYKTR